MDNYFVDYEVLAKFVDKLISEKYPHQSVAELSNIREESIRKLDDKIGEDIFGTLTEPQNAELDKLLDDPSTTPGAYQEFFKKAGINLEQSIARTMQNFAQEFLGGQNAIRSK